MSQFHSFPPFCHLERDFPAINSRCKPVTSQHDLVNPPATGGPACIPCQLLSKETGDIEECGEHEAIAVSLAKV